MREDKTGQKGNEKAQPVENIDIVYIDEDQTFAKYLNKEALQRGLSIVHFSSVEKGIDRLKNGHNLPRYFLIKKVFSYSDVGGFEAIATIQKAHACAPSSIGILGSESEYEHRKKALSLGVHHYFSLPSSPAHIIDSIEETLDGKTINSIRIIYFTDDTSECIHLSESLEKEKYDLRCVKSPDEVLSQLSQGAFDVCIAHVAHALTFELVQALRSDSSFQHLPIVLIAKEENVDVLTKYAPFHIQDIIFQPISSEVLLMRIHLLIANDVKKNKRIGEDRFTQFYTMKGGRDIFRRLLAFRKKLVLSFLHFTPHSTPKEMDSVFARSLRRLFNPNDVVIRCTDEWLCILHSEESLTMVRKKIENVLSQLSTSPIQKEYFSSAQGVLLLAKGETTRFSDLFSLARQKMNHSNHAFLEVIQENEDFFDPKQKPVLIVDSDTVLHTFLSYLYASKGHPTEVFSSGQSFIDTIESFTSENKPGLVLIEQQLQDMSGIHVLEKIRTTLGKSVPVMLLSTLGQDEVIIEGLQKGANDYLSKPFNVQYLLEKSLKLMR